MKKIYFVVDENNFIVGGISLGRMGGENVRSIEVDDEHEILSSDPEVFKFVDDELVKDEDYQQKLIEQEEAKKNKPSREDMNAIAIMELTEMIMKGGQ